MSDFFVSINNKLDIDKNNRRLEDIILYTTNDTPELTFLIEYPISNKVLYNFINVIEKQIGVNYPMQVLCVFPFEVKSKELHTDILNFYKKYHIDLKKYIPSFSKIIPIGRAIYAVTDSTDLTVNGFYDFIFNKTYFYAPELDSYVFPVDDLYLWFDYEKTLDNFKSFFALQQIDMASKFENPRFRKIALQYEKIQNIKDFVEYSKQFNKVAWDIETTGLNYFEDAVGCITFSFDGKKGFYLDFKDEYVNYIDEVLKDKFQIGANLKFDIRFIHKYGIKNAHIGFDTYQAGHILNEMRSNSLKTHAWIYTNYGGYDKPLEDYKMQSKIKYNYMKIPEKIRLPYATQDAIITFQVYKAMQKQLDWIDKYFPMDNNWSLNRYYYEVVVPALNMYVDIEEEGFYVDWEKVKNIADKLDKEIKDIKRQIYKSFGVTENEVDIDSGQSLGTFLEDVMGWSEVERAKVKKKKITRNSNEYYYKTNDDILTKWEKEGHKEATLLLKYRELNTLLHTFIGHEKDNSGIWQYKQKDGKIYPEYLVMVANSHRNRAKNPNSQNWPKHGENAKLIRSIFTTPDPDKYYFGEVDASGFQLRIGAILSGDEMMKKIFTELSGDMHSITAQQILKNDISLEEFLRRKKEKEIGEIRFKAKAINFGFLFGSSAFAFARNVLQKEWSLQECREYIIQNNLQSNYEYLVNRILYDEDISEEVQFERRKDVFKNEKNTKIFCYYWTAAIDIRKKFFKTYKGLSLFIENSVTFAKENGFVRSVFGAIRRLPELLYIGEDDSQATIKNLSNIAVNSPVQAFEITVIHLGMIALHKYIQQQGLLTRLIGMVHDSVLLYVYKQEKDLLTRKIPEIFGKIREEYKGIPIEFEGELADISKGETWGFGSVWF